MSVFGIDGHGRSISAADKHISANRAKMLKSVSLAPGSFINKKETDDAADNTSIGPSVYQSIYPRERLQNPNMHIHGLLASEYDDGNYAVTKMRPGGKPGQESDDADEL